MKTGVINHMNSTLPGLVSRPVTLTPIRETLINQKSFLDVLASQVVMIVTDSLTVPEFRPLRPYDA